MYKRLMKTGEMTRTFSEFHLLLHDMSNGSQVGPMGRLDLKLKTFLCGKKTIAPQDAERNSSANPPTFNFLPRNQKNALLSYAGRRSSHQVKRAPFNNNVEGFCLFIGLLWNPGFPDFLLFSVFVILHM